MSTLRSGPRPWSSVCSCRQPLLLSPPLWRRSCRASGAMFKVAVLSILRHKLIQHFCGHVLLPNDCLVVGLLYHQYLLAAHVMLEPHQTCIQMSNVAKVRHCMHPLACSRICGESDRCILPNIANRWSHTQADWGSFDMNNAFRFSR